MNHSTLTSLAFSLALTIGAGVTAQNEQKPQGDQSAQDAPKTTFAQVQGDIHERLQRATAELTAQRQAIADERLPLTEQLRRLESQLLERRNEYQDVSRTFDTRTLDLGNLRTEVEQRRQQSSYLSGLLGDYGQRFGTRLHITEQQRFGKALDDARLALENPKLKEQERFDVQLKVVDVSLDQVEEALGGMRFEGKAVCDGVVKPGTFVVVGPTALFRSADGDVGAAEELLGSQEPTLVPYSQKENQDAASQLALGTGGSYPLDTTLGNAQKVEKLEDTWWEHVQKGGYIMIPMAVLAGSALLVVLLKWLGMLFVSRPNKKQVAVLCDFIDGSDYASAVEQAESLPGPAGRMLEAGSRHLGEPREMVEEVMFEKVLETRLRLQSYLPFVAICATSAPLLGLLGTVTGIMNTFALMTEFGTGDPKTLSSGISEALVTTEYGLIVAIPSLLLHAFLSRKAKSIVDGMEKYAVQFMNHVRNSQPVDSHEQIEVA